jgi:PII-like signaling protein
VVKEQFPARMLRVYLNEDDRCQDRPLLDSHCRGMPRHGVGGDFALRGIEGFGAARRSGRKVTDTIHVLILVPVFFFMIKERDRRRGTHRRQSEPDEQSQLTASVGSA